MPVPPPGTSADPESARLLAGEMTAEEALRWYTKLVYRETGSYEATARRLRLDRRTVKAKVSR